MLPPPYMLPQKAPKPAAPLRCAITGKPAKYRDPSGGYGYADLEAYKELKQHMQSERRGHTGKRTKRQSSKGLNTLPPMHQQEADSDPAQLATGAAQDPTTATPASDITDLLPNQVQPAADAKDADIPGTAAASEAACAVAAPVPAVRPQPAPAVAPATADVGQAQAVLTGLQIHVDPGAAGTTAGMAETRGVASIAQQEFQQAHQLSSPATDSAAAVGPDCVVADAVTSSTLGTCIPVLPAVSKPVVNPSGQHCVTSKVFALSQCIARCFAPAF